MLTVRKCRVSCLSCTSLSAGWLASLDKETTETDNVPNLSSELHTREGKGPRLDKAVHTSDGEPPQAAGCPGAWLAHTTGDSTHNFSGGLGGSKPVQTKSITVITLSWLVYSDSTVNSSSRQLLMSDFSYQRITAIASDC